MKCINCKTLVPKGEVICPHCKEPVGGSLLRSGRRTYLILAVLAFLVVQHICFYLGFAVQKALVMPAASDVAGVLNFSPSLMIGVMFSVRLASIICNITVFHALGLESSEWKKIDTVYTYLPFALNALALCASVVSVFLMNANGIALCCEFGSGTIMQTIMMIMAVHMRKKSIIFDAAYAEYAQLHGKSE